MPAPDPSPDAAREAQRAPERVSVELDDSSVQALYANFCRVTGTPEEVIIDFGLNPHPAGAATQPMKVTQRIVTNYFTAKRLVQVLVQSVQMHERAFGTLEVNIQKRSEAAQQARKE